MALVSSFKKVVGIILDVSGIIAGLLFVFIGIISTWGVIARYLFVPAYWIEPYSIYSFIAASFFAAAYTMKRKEHIRIDMLIRLLNPNMRKLVDILTSLLALVFFIYISYRSFYMVKSSYIAGTSDLSLLQISIWIPQSFVVIGSILMCLSILYHMIYIVTEEDYEVEELDKIIE